MILNLAKGLKGGACRWGGHGNGLGKRWGWGGGGKCERK